MGNKRRRAKFTVACSDAGETQTLAPTNIYDLTFLTDDLLEHILLRITSPITLIHAAATCRSWRRLIAAGGFHRRFPSLHAPAVLGHYSYRTVFVPSAAPPRALADLLALSPNQLGCHLDLVDCRGGLLAFVDTAHRLVVFDPWTRGYGDVHLSKPLVDASSDRLGVFLLEDAGDDMGINSRLHITNFRMLLVRTVRSNGSLTSDAFVFSGSWVSLSSADLGDLMMAAGRVHGRVYTRPEFVGRVASSICWWFSEFGRMLHLDVAAGEFSAFALLEPVGDNVGSQNVRVVGAVRLVRVLAGSDIEVLSLTDGCGQCVVERRASLNQLAGTGMEAASWRFLDTTVAATGGRAVLVLDQESMWMFSLDVGTMELERLHKVESHVNRVFPYEMPWPPNINACTVGGM